MQKAISVYYVYQHILQDHIIGSICAKISNFKKQISLYLSWYYFVITTYLKK